MKTQKARAIEGIIEHEEKYGAVLTHYDYRIGYLLFSLPKEYSRKGYKRLTITVNSNGTHTREYSL